MRILLAIVAFLIAAPLLGFVALEVYSIYIDGEFSDIDFSETETLVVLGVMCGIFVAGLVFLIAGIAVLMPSARRKE